MTKAHDFFDRICRGIPIANPDKGELISAVATEFAPYLDAGDASDMGARGNVSSCELASIFTHAPHLLTLARRFPDDIPRIVNGDSAGIITNAHDMFRHAMRQAEDEATAMQAIRHFRGRVSFAAALGDIAGQTPMDAQFAWLSDAATCGVQETAHFLMRQAAQR
ncbi:MAG: hypothetical protein ACPGOZ_07005, partial [Candidatus Puniceispirillum sp.]